VSKWYFDEQGGDSFTLCADCARHTSAVCVSDEESAEPCVVCGAVERIEDEQVADEVLAIYEEWLLEGSQASYNGWNRAIRTVRFRTYAVAVRVASVIGQWSLRAWRVVPEPDSTYRVMTC
jgi:hypothetical protein